MAPKEDEKDDSATEKLDEIKEWVEKNPAFVALSVGVILVIGVTFVPLLQQIVAVLSPLLSLVAIGAIMYLIIRYSKKSGG